MSNYRNRGGKYPLTQEQKAAFGLDPNQDYYVYGNSVMDSNGSVVGYVKQNSRTKTAHLTASNGLYDVVSPANNYESSGFSALGNLMNDLNGVNASMDKQTRNQLFLNRDAQNFSLQQMQAQYMLNEASADNAFQRSVQMFNMENEYNSPAAQRARQSAAGLNPNFTDAGNVAASGSQMPQAQVGTPSTSPGEAAMSSSHGVLDLVNSVQQIAMMSENIRAAKLENEKREREIPKLESDTLYNYSNSNLANYNAKLADVQANELPLNGESQRHLNDSESGYYDELGRYTGKKADNVYALDQSVRDLNWAQAEYYDKKIPIEQQNADTNSYLAELTRRRDQLDYAIRKEQNSIAKMNAFTQRMQAQTDAFDAQTRRIMSDIENKRVSIEKAHEQAWESINALEIGVGKILTPRDFRDYKTHMRSTKYQEYRRIKSEIDNINKDTSLKDSQKDKIVSDMYREWFEGVSGEARDWIETFSRYKFRQSSRMLNDATRGTLRNTKIRTRHNTDEGFVEQQYLLP